MKYKFLSWDDIERHCENVANKVKKSKWRPDVVIALSRGGLVPARIICDILVIKDLISLKVNHWGITATKDQKAELAYVARFDLSGKNVLVVDDITDTGESLKTSVAFVKEQMHPKDIKTATLFHISHSTIKPDFYDVEIPGSEWTWIVWPWNFHEDMKNIFEKENFDHDRSKIPEFVESFNKKYSANLTRQMVEHVLSFI